ncbi:hypothetical protein Psfp_04281 [Pelotomaculum sp. FP]|uniref:hypothetical protein n=1 Tax=Pelotomaculum sp. FP TaxID=261474 RepID=UPI0010662614|nr:hypothetical protein [Pelotomaculum sp. FP]TEB09334.1 hypothetical protein Psfp_04281 [Pelotomaculum sp. FP]
MKIELKKETKEALKTIAIHYKTTPKEIIQAFLMDLTETPGSGSDERDKAYYWFQRHLIDSEFYY